MLGQQHSENSGAVREGEECSYNRVEIGGNDDYAVSSTRETTGPV